MQKSNNDLLWVVLIGVVICVVSQRANPAPAPTPVPGGGLALIVTDASDRAVLATFYKDFADVVARDTSPTTYGKFEAWHTQSTELLLQGTPLFAKYKGLGQAVATKLATAVGDQDVAIDRAKLSATLLSISQEFGS